MRSVKEIIKEIEREQGYAHNQSVRDKWDEIDEYYERRSDIKLPEVVEGETGDGTSLERLKTHTNFAKTIVNSTVTMAMASGMALFGEDGLPDPAADSPFERTEIRRLLRYTSRYGASWLQIVKNDERKKYRIYKPHVARRVMAVEDSEREEGVLVIQEFTRPDEEKSTYCVARWYEHEGRVVRRRDFATENGRDGWKPRLIGNEPTVTYDHMPWIYVPNKIEDEIYEQSDIIDGLELFKQYDALLTKYLKAMEDESFRITFLSNVSEEVAKRITRAGGLQLWYAKNKTGEAPPELQSVPPADQRQFLDGLSDLVDNMATATRTSPLELNERPVQDIPAQTLRVLYGPQIERVEETVEHVNPALTEAYRIITGTSRSRIVLQPRLPISEDKVHQNLKGLLDVGAYSRYHMLLEIGKTPEEAEAIIARSLEEKRMFEGVETTEEIKVEKAKAEARPVVRPVA